MAGASGFWGLMERIRSQWRWLIPILAIDLVGIGFGWYYYVQTGQFVPGDNDFAPYWLWPLVSDSPNAVLLAFVALLAFQATGWRSRWLDVPAFILNIYVGLWTTFIFTAYPDVMGTYDWSGAAGCLDLDGGTDCNANPILFISHMGMPLQALLLVPQMRKDPWRLGFAAAIAAFLAAYLYVDYWGPHVHPAPFLHRHGDDLLHAGSPWLMVVAFAAWLAVALWPVRPEALAEDGHRSDPAAPDAHAPENSPP